MQTVKEGVYEQLAQRISELLPAVWELRPEEVIDDPSKVPADAQMVGWSVGPAQLLIAVDGESNDFLIQEAANLSAALEANIVELLPLFKHIIPGVTKIDFPSIGEESMQMLTDNPGEKLVTQFFDDAIHRATVALSLPPEASNEESYEERFPAGTIDQETVQPEPVSSRIVDEEEQAAPGASSQVEGENDPAPLPQSNQVGNEAPQGGFNPMGQQFPANNQYNSQPQNTGFSSPLVSSVNPNALPHHGRPQGGSHMSGDAVASPAEFTSFDDYGQMQGAPHPMALLGDVEMGVTAELGRTRLTIKDILALTPGSIIELDRAAGAPVDVVVNGTLIARGEVVVIDEEFGIRITQIMGTQDAVAVNRRGEQD